MSAVISRPLQGALLLAIPVGMVVIGFVAFPPLYSLWCRVTGTGTSVQGGTITSGVGKGQVLGGGTIETMFNQRADGLPVRFYAEKRVVTMTPGVSSENVFHFVNLSDQTVRFRPVHSVAPPAAMQALQMEVCFCFKDQSIPPGESRDFPVRMYFKNDISDRVSEALITFTLFPLEAKGTANAP